MGSGFFSKKAAAQATNAGARSQDRKRVRYPYTKRNYFPDEQTIIEEEEGTATVEITATNQQMLVDKPSRMVFTMDEEPVEVGVWME